MRVIYLFLSVFLFSFLSAAVPAKIPVQGILSDKSGNVINDEAAQVTFAIYDSETDGNELWKEERTLLIEKGRMALYLGEVTPITYDKVGGKAALWLSVSYKGELMSRIQLATVPFAMESEVAHNAEAPGKFTEKSLNEMFAASCPEGSYLRGWSGKNAVCQNDDKGEGVTYTAGKGITIDGNVISVNQSIDFVAGNAIEIVNGVVSVKENLFALINHEHDNRYYTQLESDAFYYTKDQVYTKSEADSRYYKIKPELPQINNVIPMFKDGELKHSQLYIDNNDQVISQNNLRVINGKDISASTVSAATALVAGTTTFKGMKQVRSCSGVSQDVILKYGNTELDQNNSFCSVGQFYSWRAGNDADVSCEASLDVNGKWHHKVGNCCASAVCCINCVVWNW